MPANQLDLIPITDAVVAELNDDARGWSQEFTAERAYAPKLKISETRDWKVSVIGVGWTSERIDYQTNEYSYIIDIGFQKKTDGSNAAVDACVDLVGEVQAYFNELVELEGLPAYRCMSAETNPLFIPALIENAGQFTGVLRLTFSKE